jgi:hypothetical protein
LVRLADDYARNVVEKNEGDDVGVDELLGVAEVGPVLVNVRFDKVLHERDGLRVLIHLEQLPSVIDLMKDLMSFLELLFIVLVIVVITVLFMVIVIVVMMLSRTVHTAKVLLTANTTSPCARCFASLATSFVSQQAANNQNEKLARHVNANQAEHKVEDQLLVHDVRVERGLVYAQRGISNLIAHRACLVLHQLECVAQT